MNFINVLSDTGVYADGIHDDTCALQKCLDSLKDGGTVYFPDGTYLISAALIFYSCQRLVFSDNARILRSDKSEPVTRYLLAAYSEPHVKGYEGTHDVMISGGIFDGNEALTERSTLLNTVHCKNITIDGCRFVHCAHWHFIEINSTENALVQNCVFDGPTYTAISDILFNEQIQLDHARDGPYGPVYNCDGTLIDFCCDETVCRNIVIKNNIFRCAGFPAIGHHGDCDHNGILIEGNIFDGPSGREDKSRGYIFFRPMVYGLEIHRNVFLSPEHSDAPLYGIIHENPDKEAMRESDNLFIGKIDKRVITG